MSQKYSNYYERIITCFLLAVTIGITGACAYTTAKPVNYISKEEGFRIYDPLPLLIVTCQNAQFATVPDFTRGYAVEFGAVLAKNNSDLKLAEGLATEVSAQLDDTALLSMLQAWGEKALGSVKDLAALGAPVPGTIPGMEGIWRLRFSSTGEFTDMYRIIEGGPCKPNTPVAPSQVSSDAGPKTPIPFP